MIGSGTRFLSGISYYTNRLANSLGEHHGVSVILMRQLLPTRVYPGRERVGAPLTDFRYAPETRVFDGVDWFWGRSLLAALRFLRRERPDVVVLEWWTGTVLHSFLALAIAARRLGAKVVVEFHEVQDVGEIGVPGAKRYVQSLLPALIRRSDGFVVHNEFDRHALEEAYGLGGKPLVVIPHGPYDQYAPSRAAVSRESSPGSICRLLYFGVIRPFKGVDDLLRAFERLSDEEAARFSLTIVGETWEGFTLPGELIEHHRHRERIRFVNRYVADEEVAAIFGAADAVVLPYHRSSSSGPLHVAMAEGLPVVVSAVGGLIEATNGYEGAIRIPPHDPEALAGALLEVASLRGRRFADVHSWERTVTGFQELFTRVGAKDAAR